MRPEGFDYLLEYGNRIPSEIEWEDGRAEVELQALTTYYKWFAELKDLEEFKEAIEGLCTYIRAYELKHLMELTK